MTSMAKMTPAPPQQSLGSIRSAATARSTQSGNNNTNANVLSDMRRAPLPVLLHTAGEIVKQQVMESEVLRKNIERKESRYQQLPRFEERELTVGKVLGRGGFCTVQEIDKIKGLKYHHSKSSGGNNTIRSGLSFFAKLTKRGGKKKKNAARINSKKGFLPSRYQQQQQRGLDQASQEGSLRLESEFEDVSDFDNGNGNDSTNNNNNNNDGSHMRSSTKQLSVSNLMGGSPTQAVDLTLSKDFVANGRMHDTRNTQKYVIKRVASVQETEDKVTFLKGTVDLAMEAHYLASFTEQHPNVVRLVGMSTNLPHQEGYFILIEKLQETLTKRFQKWTTMDRTCKGITGVLIGSKRKVEQLMQERLEASHDIAAGAAYLHQQNIVFRDLKPDNIGFDSNDVLKIFDFGLAREVFEKDRLRNGLYRMTGLTGAMRYMAPEVGLNKPYNQSADVYSWAMIMWYILALEPPFGFYTQDMIFDRVFQRGSRPAIFRSWPTEIADTMQRAWDTDLYNRPSFRQIATVLKQELYGGGSGGSTIAGSSHCGE